MILFSLDSIPKLSAFLFIAIFLLMFSNAKGVTIFEEFSFEELNEKGVELAKLGRFEEAIKYYDKALEIKPDSWIVLYNKGKALSDLGMYEDAILQYEKVLTIEPQKYSLIMNVGYALYKLERNEDRFGMEVHMRDLMKVAKA